MADCFRQGTGCQLWQAARQKLCGMGFQKVIVLVTSNAEQARRFYESQLFKLVPNSESTFDIDEESMTDVCDEYRF